MPRGKKNKSSWKKVVLAVGAVAIVAGSVVVVKRVVDQGEMVTGVIDGDTFTISNKQNIRLLGVDAPELQYCFGKEAKEALTKKILGKKVIIKNPKTDYYKRVQAYIFVDGELINEYMSKNGFVLHRSDNGVYSGIVTDANNFAREHDLGIFSEKCSPSNPPKLGCNIKGQISYDNGDRTYLTPECGFYKGSDVERYRGENWFCTEKEARGAGFKKSGNCS